MEKLKEEVARLEKLVDKAKRIQQPQAHHDGDLGGPPRTRELFSELTELWDELETPLTERADFLACVGAGVGSAQGRGRRLTRAAPQCGGHGGPVLGGGVQLVRGRAAGHGQGQAAVRRVRGERAHGGLHALGRASPPGHPYSSSILGAR